MTRVIKLPSDYDPDTFMRIVETEDMDISLQICGKGEMKIAGVNGGGSLKSETNLKVIKLFSQIIDALKKSQT
jgi:hypothetical protein